MPHVTLPQRFWLVKDGSRERQWHWLVALEKCQARDWNVPELIKRSRIFTPQRDGDLLRIAKRLTVHFGHARGRLHLKYGSFLFSSS